MMPLVSFFRPIRKKLACWLYEQDGFSSRLKRPVRIGIGSGFFLGGILLYFTLTRDNSGNVSFASQTLFNLQASEKAQELLGSPASMKMRTGSYFGESSMFFGNGTTHIQIVVDGERGSVLAEAMANRRGFYWATKFLKITPFVSGSTINGRSSSHFLNKNEGLVIVNELN